MAEQAAQPVRAVARRREGFAHDIEIEGRHRLVSDEPAAAGGADAGPSPTRLVAAGLASCTAITMEMYADRKGWDLDDVEVDVDVELQDYAPRSFAVTVHLPEGLDEERRGRLLTIAAKCPVHKALAGATEITVSEGSARPA